MESLRFIIPGVPRPWQRTRGSGRRRFTSPEIRRWKELVRSAAMAAGARPFDGPVELVIRAYWPSRKPARKRTPRPEEWKATLPDWDNVGKGISDALNKIAWHDDGQVARAIVETRRAKHGEDPRTEVEIVQMGVLVPQKARFQSK